MTKQGAGQVRVRVPPRRSIARDLNARQRHATRPTDPGERRDRYPELNTHTDRRDRTSSSAAGATALESRRPRAGSWRDLVGGGNYAEYLVTHERENDAGAAELSGEGAAEEIKEGLTATDALVHPADFLLTRREIRAAVGSRAIRPHGRSSSSKDLARRDGSSGYIAAQRTKDREGARRNSGKRKRSML